MRESVHVMILVLAMSKKGNFYCFIMMNTINDPIFNLRMYDPVCGMDNKTYSNQCELQCRFKDLKIREVQAQCKGECPCKKDCSITRSSQYQWSKKEVIVSKYNF